ncbi:uncharacterized protein METZ01_LOCUS451469, partial [marine metagenome]
MTLPSSRKRQFVLVAILLLGATTRAGADSVTTAPDSLDLRGCLDTAMSRNRELIQARERIEEVEGDRIVVRSRFMPNVQLTASYD